MVAVIIYRLSVPYHAQRVVFLAQHDNSENNGGNLGSRALTPTDISYEPQINSRTVQEERTVAGALRKGETAKIGTVISGKSQGGRRNLQTKNGEAGLGRSRGQVSVSVELRGNVIHGF